jgi:hypothetical protein
LETDLAARQLIWRTAQSLLRAHGGMAEHVCAGQALEMEEAGNLQEARHLRIVLHFIPRIRRGEAPPPDYRSWA